MWSQGWVPLTLVSVFLATPNSCSAPPRREKDFSGSWGGGQEPQISPSEHKNGIVSACHLPCDAGTPAGHRRGAAPTGLPAPVRHQAPSASPRLPLLSLGATPAPFASLPTLHKQSKWQMAPGLGNKQKPGGQWQQWAPSCAQADPVPPEGDGWGCPRWPLAWSWAPAGTWLAPAPSLPTPPIPAARPASQPGPVSAATWRGRVLIG